MAESRGMRRQRCSVRSIQIYLVSTVLALTTVFGAASAEASAAHSSEPSPFPTPEGCDDPGTDDRCETWASTDAGEDESFAAGVGDIGDLSSHRAVVTSRDGKRVFVLGYVERKTEASPDPADWDRDLMLVAHDGSDGTRVWSTTWSGWSDQPNVGQRGIAISPNSETIYALVTTYADDDEAAGVTVVAFSTATGELDWAYRLRVPGEDYVVATAIEVVARTKRGPLVLVAGYPSAGEGYGYPTHAEYRAVGNGDVLFALTRHGRLAWKSLFRAGGDSAALSLAISPDQAHCLCWRVHR